MTNPRICWKSIVWCAAFALPGIPAFAQPFDVPLDPNASTLTVELCVLGTCRVSNRSDVEGTITIELDALNAPTQITLHDFYMRALDDVHVVVDIGPITGRIEITGHDLSASYGGSVPSGPVPIIGDAFTFTDVLTSADGMVDLHATGLICVALVEAGICPSCPCDITIDLGLWPPQLTEFSGTVTANNGLVAFTGIVDMTIPFDPAHPNVGHLRVLGTGSGEVQVATAICGDANCDGVFNGGDIDAFFLALADPAEWELQYGCGLLDTCDINRDGLVNGADIDPFFEGLGIGRCP